MQINFLANYLIVILTTQQNNQNNDCQFILFMYPYDWIIKNLIH